MKKFFIFMFSITLLFGCTSDKTGKTLEKKEDLEKEIPTHKMWDDDNPAVDKAVMSRDAAAYAFDFQTYFILQERLTHYLESNTIAKTKEYSEWRTDRINKEKNLVPNHPKHERFIVTGFHNKDDKKLSELKSKYSTITYKEEKKYYALHWVSNDMYYRYIFFKDEGIVFNKEEMMKEAKYIKEANENYKKDPSVIPSFILHLGREMLSKEEKTMQITYMDSYNYDHSNINLTFPANNSVEESKKIADKWYGNVMKLLKEYPFYQENKLKTEGPTISLQFETNDAKKEEFQTGIAIVNAIKWEKNKNEIDTETEGEVNQQTGTAEKIIKDFKDLDNSSNKREGALVSFMGKGKQIILLDSSVTFDMSAQTKIEVWYEVKKDEWKQVYYQNIKGDAPLKLSPPVKLMGDSRESVILQGYEGSGGYLHFAVIGSPNNKQIKLLFDSAQEERFYPNGKIQGKSNGFSIESDENNDQYIWKDNKFIRQ
ncbi:hypothetical protein NXB04_26645 [Bacillus paranthracis]|uniref:hypothetical protein n=1 Tax=Bacillus paranthracis TaxID=2026186 RepID=UPI002151D7E7|nr:hypothetical protein [Bacillus paranthracis]MCR6462287.1 hypothetical protein [Bacillus paranthracis]MCR9022727.1 hypothetical protein [Bacillus paranthracis]